MVCVFVFYKEVIIDTYLVEACESVSANWFVEQEMLARLNISHDVVQKFTRIGFTENPIYEI
eukprot:snap_masked-scaffold_4-processed-gene-1.10-mRNA-1 protein AED:1.00 eAED:1.00 QI:0/0/0/0/1/1/3/0/61